MLFGFAGYINYNFKNLSDALLYYRRAIDLNDKYVDAWKGAFEVYNNKEWTDFHDDFSVKVVDHLLK